jgi:hypothetical protein
MLPSEMYLVVELDFLALQLHTAQVLKILMETGGRNQRIWIRSSQGINALLGII